MRHIRFREVSLRRKILKVVLLLIIIRVNYGYYVEYPSILKHQREVTAQWDENDAKRDQYIIENALPDEVLIETLERFSRDVLGLSSLIIKSSSEIEPTDTFASFELYIDDEFDNSSVRVNRLSGKIFSAYGLEHLLSYAPKYNTDEPGNKTEGQSVITSNEVKFEEVRTFLEFYDLSTKIEDYHFPPQPRSHLKSFSIIKLNKHSGIEYFDIEVAFRFYSHAGIVHQFYYIPSIPPAERLEPTITKREAYKISKKWLKRSGKCNLGYFVAGDFDYGGHWDSYGLPLWINYFVSMKNIEERIYQKRAAIDGLNETRYCWVVPFTWHVQMLGGSPFEKKILPVLVDTTSGEVLGFP